MGTSKSEQNRLRQFLDGFEDQGSSSPVAPVQLSSTSPPFHAKSPRTNTNSAGGIQINTLFIQPATSSRGISKKKTVELLSDDQKRANHIASEQKRRANIRIGFEKLVDIVPTLKHLRQLVESKTVLKEKARKLQLMLGEIPDEDSSEGEIDYDF
ncbi:helix-loop-helix DNA-binding domain-containing transcription factor [Mucor lusitanicus CBS 277.49]|uniref:Helix-loop-helix DNA-binding domain-containing transcription factor n=1 Tax=Mucor lusitanicus CBS 277.49 TaxID=747725 RepID=A0A168JGP4_MUCCL|nr:helix-loop-helix DNA-binding domain-containing transcription factor [Mucor lusitanicus CBS 277.49]